MGKILNSFKNGYKAVTGQAALANYHMNFDKFNPLFDYGRRGLSKGDAAQELEVYAGGSASWVNIALNRKMLDVSNVDYYFVDKDGNKIEIADVPEDLAMSFQAGYAGIGFHELLAMAVGHEDLTGNALWVKNTNVNRYTQLSGVPGEFIPIPPGKFKININSQGTKILSYTVRWKDGTTNDYVPDQVVHFKRNPLVCPLYGIGLISQGRMNIDYMSVAMDYQITFLEKDGTPDLVYIDKNAMLPEDAEVKAKALRSEYAAGKMSNSLLYAYGDVDVKSFAISSADLQFIENKKLNDEQVICLMESTASVLGNESKAGNTAIADRSSLNYFGIVNSRVDHMIEFLNSQHFLKLKGNEKLQIRLSYTPYPVGDITQIQSAITNGLMTPAHGSKELGYPVKTEKEDPASHTLYMTRTLGTMQSVFETQPLSFGGLSDGIVEIKKKTMRRDYQLSTSQNVDPIPGNN